MSLPDNLTIPSLPDCRFYHENLPSISVVHSHMPQAAQVSQHATSTSPLPSPLHQLHHPQVGGHQGHIYALRSNSHGSLEPNKFGFKHNQGSILQGQNHTQANFNAAPGMRNQQQYNRNMWRRRKRGSLPALNQSRWKAKAASLNLTGISPSSLPVVVETVMVRMHPFFGWLLMLEVHVGRHCLQMWTQFKQTPAWW